MIIAVLVTEIRNLSTMILALRKFDLKEDKLEIEYQNKILKKKRHLGFDFEGCGRKLQITRGINLFITEINSKNQSIFLFRLIIKLMLLLAIFKRLKSLKWFPSC